MRTSPFAAMLALVLLTALPASAQMPAPAYTLAIQHDPTAVYAPGSTATYNLTAERTCQNQVDILEASVVRIDVKVEMNLTVTGPGQLNFPQQFCAQQSRQAVPFTVTVIVGEDAFPRTYLVQVHLVPQHSGPTFRFGNDATLDFAVPVKAPAADKGGAEPAGDQTSPGVAPALLFVVLVAAALAGRKGL